MLIPMFILLAAAPSDLDLLLRAAAERSLPDDVRLVSVASVPKLPKSTAPVDVAVTPLARRLVGRVPAKVELRIGDRTLRFQIVLVVEQIYSVVRLARAARKGDIIASADVVVEQARSVDALERPIGDLALCLGKRLRSDAAAGSTLLPRDLEAIPIVHPKDPVRVTMKSGALFASAPGEAQQAGARGDTIRVINLLSSKIVLARVLDATSVEMLP